MGSIRSTAALKIKRYLSRNKRKTRSHTYKQKLSMHSCIINLEKDTLEKALRRLRKLKVDRYEKYCSCGNK